MNLMNTVFKRKDMEEFGICGLHMKDVQPIKVMQIFCGPEKKNSKSSFVGSIEAVSL